MNCAIPFSLEKINAQDVDYLMSSSSPNSVYTTLDDFTGYLQACRITGSVYDKKVVALKFLTGTKSTYKTQTFAEEFDFESFNKVFGFKFQ